MKGCEEPVFENFHEEVVASVGGERRRLAVGRERRRLGRGLNTKTDIIIVASTP